MQSHNPFDNPPFKGRQSELNKFKDLAEQASLGNTLAYLIMGVPGVGKSTLVREFVKELESNPAFFPVYVKMSVICSTDALCNQIIALITKRSQNIVETTLKKIREHEPDFTKDLLDKVLFQQYSKIKPRLGQILDNLLKSLPWIGPSLSGLEEYPEFKEIPAERLVKVVAKFCEYEAYSKRALILVFDQWDETENLTEGQRDQFCNVLRNLIEYSQGDQHIRLLILVVVREGGFSTTIRGTLRGLLRQFIIDPMEPQQLMESIVEALKRGEVRFEDSVIKKILTDSGRVPFITFSFCRALYEKAISENTSDVTYGFYKKHAPKTLDQLFDRSFKDAINHFLSRKEYFMQIIDYITTVEEFKDEDMLNELKKRNINIEDNFARGIVVDSLNQLRKSGFIVAKDEKNQIYAFWHALPKRYLESYLRQDQTSATINELAGSAVKSIHRADFGTAISLAKAIAQIAKDSGINPYNKEFTKKLLKVIPESVNDPYMFSKIVVALALQGASAKRQILDFLQEVDRNIRRYVVIILGEVALDESLDDLEGLLSDESESEDVRRMAALYRDMKSSSPEIASKTDNLLRSKVPAGKFFFGDEELMEELVEEEIEKPFLIDIFPVTNGQYLRYVHETGATPPLNWFGNPKRPASGTLGHPVVFVNLEEAKKYARHRGMELPTDKQWERAARGLDKRIYPWGNEKDATCLNSAESGVLELTHVGLFPRGVSPVGCYDMAGGCYEWTSSPYDAAAGTYSLRGGCYADTMKLARCGYRNFYEPWVQAFETSFRCVKTL